MKKISWDQVLGNKQHEAFESIMSLAGVYRMLGDYDAAEEFYRQAQVLAIASGRKDDQVAAAWFMSNLHYHAGRYDIAFDEAISLGVEKRDYLVQRILMAKGDYVGRLEHSNLACASDQTTKSLLDQSCRLADHVDALIINGLYSEAWKAAKRLVKLQNADLVSPHGYMINWLGIARTHLELGHHEEAVHWAIRALGLAEKEGHLPHQLTSRLILINVHRGNVRKTQIVELSKFQDRLADFREDLTQHIQVRLALAQAWLDYGNFESAGRAIGDVRVLLDRHKRFPEYMDYLLLQARYEGYRSNWAEVSRILAQAKNEEETTIRAKRHSLALPLVYCRMWAALGEFEHFKLQLEIASSRYQVLTSGLPDRVRRSFADRRDAALLRELKRHHY